MSILNTVFTNLKKNNKTALIPYITAGDPSLDLTLQMMNKFVENGADVIELGIPFSDPMADGPVIQAAHERALLNNVSLSDVLDLVKIFRKTNSHTAVVLMGYLNPIEKMGYQTFAVKASSAGIDAVLTVDLPPEEGVEFCAIMEKSGIDCIFLIAPTTTPQRIEKINKTASGFVYYVSLKGVTGSANLDIVQVGERCKLIKQTINLPVGVGFGISDATSAKAIAEVADAVIVGSAIIKKIANNLDDSTKIILQTSEFLSELRKAIDS